VTNPFIRKLEYGADLTDEDRAVLASVSANARPMAAHTDIIREGDKPDTVHLVMEGYACRYKLLPDGKRQIMALFVPGDLCDLHVQILGEMDHSIATLSNARIVEIPTPTVGKLIENPRINRALWWASLVDEGTLREWLVSMGQRDSGEQMAHVFCELYVRLDSIGLVRAKGFDFPLTQNELADLMGITPVHVNRVIGRLRDEALVDWSGGRVVIPDFDRLRDLGGFDPNYLHLRDRKKRAVPESRERVPI
jgi:CRP-like cAMP-binding protein